MTADAMENLGGGSHHIRMQGGGDGRVAQRMRSSAVAMFDTLDDLHITWLAARRRSACRSGAPPEDTCRRRDNLLQHCDVGVDEGDEGRQKDPSDPWTSAPPELAGHTLVYLALLTVRPALGLLPHVDDAHEAVQRFCRRMSIEGRVLEGNLQDTALLPPVTTSTTSVTALAALDALVDVLRVTMAIFLATSSSSSSFPLIIVPGCEGRDTHDDRQDRRQCIVMEQCAVSGDLRVRASSSVTKWTLQDARRQGLVTWLTSSSRSLLCRQPPSRRTPSSSESLESLESLETLESLTLLMRSRSHRDLKHVLIQLRLPETCATTSTPLIRVDMRRRSVVEMKLIEILTMSSTTM